MTFPVLSAGTSAYNLTNSLRFRSSASAFLNRTPASASNRRTWTWSGWVKLGSLSVGRTLFAVVVDANNRMHFDINSSDQLQLSTRTSGLVQGNLFTNAVFRDPSAWYHIVCVWDSTKTTVAAGISIAVNGVQQTLTTSVAVTTNADGWINSANATDIGRLGSLAFNFFDGYLDEVNFIDGQALTPSSFGSTNPVTGVWQPAKYTGTYGTNGFYLPFTNTTSTTTLGNDFSGNGNNWTTNNISLTPGVTYDSMTDVPTLTSPTAANFPVLNPLFVTTSAFSLLAGNLRLSQTSAATATVFSTIGVLSGSWFFETTVTTYAGDCFIGLTQISGSFGSASVVSNGVYRSDGTIYNGSAWVSYGASYTTGDVIGCAFDPTNLTVTFYKNGTSQGQKTITFSGLIFSTIYSGASGNVLDINFGQRPFAYTPPSGFVALNTFNLPSSTIQNGASFMAATLATGNNSTQVITNTVGSASFQPDFVWMKIRSTSENHIAYDSVRGVQNFLVPNLTLAEGTSSQGLTSFNSNGFTLGNINPNYAGSPTFVAWQWRANGAGVTNTAGTITSTVSANTTSGFSVVKWNGSGNATIGHGLGVAPSMYIVKLLDQTSQWYVYFRTLGAGSYVQLNLTAGVVSDTAIWQNTAPTSTVFYIGSGINANNMIAYCFAPIAGFSAFGSYTGNGSTDGPFIYTGFRPKFVLIKNTDTAGRGWEIIDSSRNTFNVANSILQPDSAAAESTSGSYQLDFVSNGFKIRGIDTWLNASGGTYIYACFAENPFKNALAR